MGKKGITWTAKQREVAALVEQGKQFMDIIALGYSKDMTHKVMNALKKGQKPPEKPKPKDDDNGSNHELLGFKTPSPAPIVFKIDQKQIVLDPLEINSQYRYYENIAKGDNLGYSFSEILTMGIQLVWLLKQDIPLTENLLRAVFYGYK